MRSILLSNIPHYHHLAEGLHDAGILERYISSNLLLDGESAPNWMPEKWSRRLEGRRLRGVPRNLVRQIRLPEFLQRALPMMKLLSLERGDWLNNVLFDRLALPGIQPCDIFHFVSSVGLLCARKAKDLGATIICDVRQEHPRFQRMMLEEEARHLGMQPQVTGSTYERRVLDEFELADFIVVPSTHAKRTFVAEGFSVEKILTLPYGVELNDFHTSATRPNAFRIVYAGSLTLRKGPQYLLEAVAGLDLSGVELILAGPIDPSFKPILARFEGSFKYVGVLPKLDLQVLYAGASVFALPSLADSFSLATLEAMACGLPVIISENTGAGDVVEDGRSGFVVPIRNAAAIRHKIEFLRDNEEARLEMGSRAAERAKTMSWTSYGAKAIEMYDMVFAARTTSKAQNSRIGAIQTNV